jgi:mRNA guanylyltransferase
LLEKADNKYYINTRLFTMNLGDLVKKMESTSSLRSDQPSAKKSRVSEAIEYPLFDTIGNSLHEIWKEAKMRRDTGVVETFDNFEVEIRLGMLIKDQIRRWKSQKARNLSISGAIIAQKEINMTHTDLSNERTPIHFKAGIDEIVVEHLKRILYDTKEFSSIEIPPTRQKYDNHHNRWEILSNGEMKNVENKQRFYRKDIALVAHTYDIRIDAANELPITTNIPVPKEFVHDRLKKRTTFRSKDAAIESNNYWQIDLTEVVSIEAQSSKNTSSNKEYELELEVDRALMISWLSESNSDKAISIIREMTTQFYKFLNHCIPHEEEATATTLTPYMASHIQSEIKKMNATLRSSIGYTQGNVDSFLGSLPINFTRRNLLNVQRASYYLTEKSDGVRHLMYIIPDIMKGGTIALLMDRSRTIYKFPGSEIIGGIMGAGTVLDGELVYNRTLKETVFLIFDVLELDGSATLQHPFAHRTKLLADVVVPRISTIPPSSADHAVMRLTKKNFVEKSKIGDLLSKIKIEDGSRVFRDNVRDASGVCSHHKTDGFIFQPDAPYVFNCDSDLLKWKWPEQRSVDLEVIESSNEDGNVLLKLYSDLMPENIQVDCTKRGSGTVSVGKFDTYRLIADMQDYERNNGRNSRLGRIAEVYYDTTVGMWGYLHLRSDKEKPNELYTVLGVFMEQADAISIEELEYRLIGSADKDDYSTRYVKMKSQLLNWKKSNNK